MCIRDSDYTIVGGYGFFDIVTNSEELDVHYVDTEDEVEIVLKGSQKTVWHYLLLCLFYLNQELIIDS